jgi:hypothetical protein
MLLIRNKDQLVFSSNQSSKPFQLTLKFHVFDQRLVAKLPAITVLCIYAIHQ